MVTLMGSGKTSYLYVPATNALRKTPYTGTIPCIICCRPAIGQAPDGNYYCDEHMRQKYGFDVPIGAQYKKELRIPVGQIFRY